MSEAHPNTWIWTAAVAVASSIGGLMAVWYIIVAPRMLDPSVAMARDAERKQLADRLVLEFRNELARSAQAQRQYQDQQFEAAMKRLEDHITSRIEMAAERAAQRQLSAEFLQDLRSRVLDQAVQLGTANALQAAAAPDVVAVLDAMLREDLNTLSSARTAVTEFWMNAGRAPTSNADAGLTDPQTFSGQILRTLTIGKDGSIDLGFDPKIGMKGARLVLTPTAAANNLGSLNWSCSTNIPAALRILPVCELRTQMRD